ncbi:hypothetical protein B0A55_13125 [Friedmanniomyces simplex]|uniref:Cleavage/polyadenylation specificity factor A subunit N-terminal domain-containing protein n=1 Tax=Friedmanniomyces simplex TaxID=329884 RepID=A0A4U0VMA3_9PEZI|nr:hypothetical protein B0A55_13125 [Friedmanniomyces simplex]
MVNGTGFPNAADSLGSQNSVVLLFTVNAGSDTVVMFRIDKEDPCHPKMIGEPASTLGQFPISVAYSDSLRMLCVLNGGAEAGVACFNADPLNGLKNLGALRSLGNAIHETTPPSGPPGSAAEISFNPESSAVFVSLKGNAGAIPKQPGFILAWPVEHGQIGDESVVSQIADIEMDFGFAFLPGSRIFISDPSYGVSILEVGTDHEIVEEAHIVVNGSPRDSAAGKKENTKPMNRKSSVMSLSGAPHLPSDHLRGKSGSPCASSPSAFLLRDR